MNTDNSALLVFVLTAILLVALGINYSYHKQQQRILERRLKAQQLQFEAEKQLKTLSILKRINCPVEVVSLLTGYVTKVLTHLSQLKPEQGVMEKLQSQTTLGDNAEPVDLENPNNMKRVQAELSALVKFIRQHHRKLDLAADHAEKLCLDLYVLYRRLEIDTQFKVGRRMLEADKLSLAISHFNNAQKHIRKLPYNNPERKHLLDEANELIAQALPFGDKDTDQEQAPEEQNSGTLDQTTDSQQPAVSAQQQATDTQESTTETQQHPSTDFS